MNADSGNSDKVVDGFVAFVNSTLHEPKSPDEVPEELRRSAAEHGAVNWQIRPAASNPWVDTLAQKLPQSWPKAFRSLIDRYRFCNVEVGPLMLFANSGHDLFYELSSRIFKDKGIFPVLHQHGFLQFGLPHEANYDPVCFDMKRRKDDDAPIVQLDHEEILIRNRIRVVKEISPSFTEFMHLAIVRRFPVS